MGKLVLCERGACGGRAAFKFQTVINNPTRAGGMWRTQDLCPGHAEIAARDSRTHSRMIPYAWYVEAQLDAEVSLTNADQLAWAMP